MASNINRNDGRKVNARMRNLERERSDSDEDADSRYMRLEYDEGDDDENEVMENEGDIDFMMSGNTVGFNDSADHMQDIEENSIGSQYHPHANLVPHPSTTTKKLKRHESNPQHNERRNGGLEEEEKEPVKVTLSYLDRCKQVGRIGPTKAELDLDTCCGNVK